MVTPVTGFLLSMSSWSLGVDRSIGLGMTRGLCFHLSLPLGRPLTSSMSAAASWVTAVTGVLPAWGLLLGEPLMAGVERKSVVAMGGALRWWRRGEPVAAGGRL